jgi:DNA-directed RNA polymerase subunit RPC12/RpoP
MRKQQSSEFVYSKPTMCLECHLVVTMTHKADADPVKGAWECPRCGHRYPFAFWKIRKAQAGRSKAA